ncbi:MAG: Sec-independent protein translocase protein TatB [Methylococcaceae bacterium]
MFEIGFSELCMVGLVALLVIGPEKLPKVARIAGFWIGKTRNMVASVQAEIKQELHAEEIRQALKEQSGIKEFHQMFDEASDTVNVIKSSIEQLPENKIAKAERQDESK